MTNLESVKSNLRKLKSDLIKIRLEIGERCYVELYSLDKNEYISYSEFGKMLYNLFDMPKMWPRIGESVRDLNGNTYIIEDILTYTDSSKFIKCFYIRKKENIQQIVKI